MTSLRRGSTLSLEEDDSSTQGARRSSRLRTRSKPETEKPKVVAQKRSARGTKKSESSIDDGKAQPKATRKARSTEPAQKKPSLGTKQSTLILDDNDDSTDATASGQGATPVEQNSSTVKKKQSGVPSMRKGPKISSLNLLDYLEQGEWKEKLQGEFVEPYMEHVHQFLLREMNVFEVYPPRHLIFHAFNLTPLSEVKVVILGQDPYHDSDQAHGLSFSVPRGVKIPRSLGNIYKELSRSIPDYTTPEHGCLEAWAHRGVLLLNATLTVRSHQPNSHAKMGWQQFTDAAIKVMSDCGPPCVFLLWGGFAHKKAALVDKEKHRVIKTAHPSPLSFNKFMDCNCFVDVNKALVELGRESVDWTIE